MWVQISTDAYRSRYKYVYTQKERERRGTERKREAENCHANVIKWEHFDNLEFFLLISQLFCNFEIIF